MSTLNAQPTLWEAILPEMCLGMPAELEAVDRLLDDSAFFEQQGPCRHHGGSRQRCLPDGLGPDGQGRGQDGQEHREAQGCGTGLEDQVAGPDSHDAGPGPVHWCQLSRRSGEAKDEVMAINADMVRIARVAVAEARHVAANARRALKRLGDAAPRRLCSIAGDLEITAGRVARIAEQTEKRLGGEVPDGASRLVSLHDPDARPIRKGRQARRVRLQGPGCRQ